MWTLSTAITSIYLLAVFKEGFFPSNAWFRKWPNDSITFPLYVTNSNSILFWTTFVKEVCNFMLGFKSDKMPVLRPNGRLPLRFYEAFENSNFCRGNFLIWCLVKKSDEMTAVWLNNS